jgi:hypothetical protein
MQCYPCLLLGHSVYWRPIQERFVLRCVYFCGKVNAFLTRFKKDCRPIRYWTTCKEYMNTFNTAASVLNAFVLFVKLLIGAWCSEYPSRAIMEI